MSKHLQASDVAPVDDAGFRRVHRLTPLLRFWSLILALIAILIVNVNAEMLSNLVAFARGEHRAEALRGTAIAAVAFVLVCLAIWFLSALWWRRLGFRLDEEEIALRRGLISTQLRSARYDRTQAVDVVESVIARIFGLAAVRVETAGGANSVIEIAYLKKAEAEKLRAEILGQVRREGREVAPERAVVVEPTVAPEGLSVIPEIPIRRSLVAAALHPGTVLAVVSVAATVLAPIPNSAALPVVVGFLPKVWELIDSSWRYCAFLDRDAHGNQVLNISYGLADRRRQSIRFERIHGVRVAQPWMWRLFGWYQVQVSIAGYGATAGKGSGSTRILPVGSREHALALFELVGPLDAAEITEYALPEGATRPTFNSPRRAWWASPVDRAQQAVTLLGDATVTHAGRLTRRVMAIENSHIQELTYQAGPVDQLCNLASVRLELVGGPVRMRGSNLAPDDAAELIGRLRARQLPAPDKPMD
ncbi:MULTISPECIES: PH domain-containing protein [Corynebacterium]|uniref:PH domain-containing protein n=1 Tax=Corynebacterium TaxID=1716 RepID=UPI002579517F|nr:MULTISPECIES: PH domain-containing protein [Corynebacterium]